MVKRKSVSLLFWHTSCC